MKKSYKKPLTVEKMAALSDSDIDFSDIPEYGDEFWKKAKIVPPRIKPNVSLRLPKEVVNYFKEKYPKGYTTRMAIVLQAYVQAQQSR